MKRIRIALWTVLLLPSALWLAADSLPLSSFEWFAFRTPFVQYTGVLAIVAMSVAMVLAVRPRRLEPPLDGLDKMYRLHKWLGIAALVLAIVHWWWAQGTKWMVGWGWLVRPERRGAGAIQLGPLEQWLRDQRGLAETMGEWAFYAVAALIVVALVRRIPYHVFAWLHRWISVPYLVLAFHTVVLTDFDYWSQPVGWLVAASLAGGTAAALVALTRRIGAGRKASGRIESLDWYPELRVLETTVRLDGGWAGHAAGQFAFVTSRKSEGAHPYTIASAWDPADPRIVFITKALGDHTERLHERLEAGAQVMIEGPYGRFDFSDDKPRQIWIGAGIGITPFVARMKQLARTPGSQAIELFHPTADYSQAAIDKLTADARAAGVRLHLLVSGRDGRLDADRIRAAVPQWRDASLWFCGPAAFGEALRRDFVAAGLSPDDFHQELFEMR